MSENEDWYNKFKSTKKILDELRKIRITAVQQDIDMLSLKMEEHKETHEQFLSEIKSQIQSIEKQNEKYDKKKRKIRELEESIMKLRFELGKGDPVIRTLVDFPFLKVLMQKNRTYAVQIQADNYPSFYLIREKGGIRYIPDDSFPSDFPSWMKEEKIITNQELKMMCSNFEKYFIGDGKE